jgi:DNA-directed RNA polymerase subunit omega
MNSELLKIASEKVGNPGVLVNLISRRVRQLSRRDGLSSRSLVTSADNLGVADIALREIVEEKMGREMPEVMTPTRPAPKRIKRRECG